MSASVVGDKGLTWDQLRTLPARDQPKAAALSKEMYAFHNDNNILQRESCRRRLVSMVRAVADGV